MHQELLERKTVHRELSPETVNAAGQVKDLLKARNLKMAFTQLYRLQKSLAKSETVSAGDLTCYSVLAHVLSGTPCPGVEDLATSWHAI